MKLSSFLPSFLKIFILEHRHIFKEVNKKHKRRLMSLIESNKGKSLSIDDEYKWVHKFCKLTYAYPDLIEVGEAFATSEIRVLSDKPIRQNEIIAICVVKNDIVKIKQFICHHRTIGVDKFVILDNMSTDGSVDWLKEQDDVVLLQTSIPYSTNRREGWINRIIAHYGDNRWYLVADSDELLVYNGCEQHNLHEVVNHFKNQKIYRIRALMVDMYAQSEYYVNGSIEDCFKQCVFMDSNSYYYSERNHLKLICGGPRERVFHQSPWLTKYPLFYFRSKDIECKSHFFFPLKDNLKSKCNLVLKHYKFQPGELEKIKNIVESGNYYNGSTQYKNYLRVLEESDRIDFICDNTVEYSSSDSLNLIGIYDPIDW